MKKVLAIAFVGGLILASCAKKENVEETNTMLTEDSVTVTPDPIMDSAAVIVPVDSTMAK